MTETEIPSLACNLSAMTSSQRASYEEQKRRLRAALIDLQESASGFDFHFADEPGLILCVAEFIENERRCCPFYTFQIDLEPGCDTIRLRVTGPNEAREFIRDALSA